MTDKRETFRTIAGDGNQKNEVKVKTDDDEVRDR
jgi:hypothetical protein